MKKFLFILIAVSAILCCGAEKPKYLFLFIGDGMSVPQRMIAEEFARLNDETIVMNHFPHKATTTTSCVNSVVTDSAAAATAIACGTKTRSGRLGVDKDGKRLESMAEVAKKAGYKVGIVTSVNLNHATPGGFYAHRKSRGDEDRFNASVQGGRTASHLQNHLPTSAILPTFGRKYIRREVFSAISLIRPNAT